MFQFSYLISHLSQPSRSSSSLLSPSSLSSETNMSVIGGDPKQWMEFGLWLIKSSVLCLLVSIVLGLLFLVYFYVPCWGLRRIPGPQPTPIVGHLHMLAKFGPDVLRSIAKTYGPIFRFHLGRQPLVIVADPELCREVGMKRFKDIKNRSNPSPTSGSSLHEKGLFMSRDSRWSSMRNAIIPFYQPAHLTRMINTMQSIIESAVGCNLVGDGEEINLSHFSLRIAIDIIGETAFGVQFGLTQKGSSTEENEEDDNEVSGFLKQHMYSTESLKMDLNGSLSTILGFLFPFVQKPCRFLLQHIRGTADHRMSVINQVLRKRIDRIVEKRVEDLNQKREAKDFLSALLIAKDSGKLGADLFTFDYISALSYEHLLAGTATTAFTISSVVYLVCKHPNVETKLLKEIIDFGHQTPTAADLQNAFPYLDQVVKESMRFYTVSPLVARETSTQVEIGGHVLPKYTWVWLALGVLAKDPKNFPEPDVFRPERFDRDCLEERTRHPYAYIPFGIGPRTCIGQKFALQEIKLCLINLYRKYFFRLSSSMESPPEIEYGLVLNFKNGVKVQVFRRT